LARKSAEKPMAGAGAAGAAGAAGCVTAALTGSAGFGTAGAGANEKVGDGAGFVSAATGGAAKSELAGFTSSTGLFGGGTTTGATLVIGDAGFGASAFLIVVTRVLDIRERITLSKSFPSATSASGALARCTGVFSVNGSGDERILATTIGSIFCDGGLAFVVAGAECFAAETTRVAMPSSPCVMRSNN